VVDVVGRLELQVLLGDHAGAPSFAGKLARKSLIIIVSVTVGAQAVSSPETKVRLA
jgi:hypothetical protein